LSDGSMPENLSTWLPLRHPFSIVWPTAERLPLNQKQASCVRQTALPFAQGRRSQTSARWKTSSGRCWTQNQLHIFLCPAYRNRSNGWDLRKRRPTTIPKTDLSSELVAKGEAELAIVPVTQAFTTPGVELAGPLPSEIQFYTAFGGAISANSKSRDAAAELLKFLKGSSALRVIKEQGMEPI
jgi:Bacterial extracellular solute-binding protein